VERLCMVCDMEIAGSGAIRRYRFYPAVMFSHARLTYTEVAAACTTRMGTPAPVSARCFRTSKRWTSSTGNWRKSASSAVRSTSKPSKPA